MDWKKVSGGSGGGLF